MKLREKRKRLKGKQSRITLFFPGTNPGVYPPLSPPLPNLGIGYIGTVLKRNGYTVQCVDGNVICPEISIDDHQKAEYVLDRSLQEIQNTQPDILGIGSWTMNFPFAAELVTSFADANPHTLVILGGYQATFLPEFVLGLLPQIDILVIGEGEHTTLELMVALEHGSGLERIDGIVYRDRDRIVRTAPRALIADLNDLPFIDYDLFVGFKPQKEHGLMILTSRGCPHNCVFCSCKAFWKVIRTRRVENVIAEIKHLRDTYAITSFGICDDLFSFSKKRVLQFCEMLDKESISMGWSFNSRIDSLDEGEIEVLLRSGAYRVCCGLESVHTGTLSYIGEKQPEAYREKALKLLNLCITQGVPFKFSTIVGFPNETEDEIRQMLAFVSESNAKGILMGTGLPICFPGTRLWEKYKRNEISLVRIENPNLRRSCSGFFSEKYAHLPECVPNAWMIANDNLAPREFEALLLRTRSDPSKVEPILCFNEYGRDNKQPSTWWERGRQFQAEFRRRMKNARWRLIDERELFQTGELYALFNGKNLRVVYFADRLAEIITRMQGYLDITDVQGIHDTVTAQFPIEDGIKSGAQWPRFWRLLLELADNDFLQAEGFVPIMPAHRQVPAGSNNFTELVILPSLRCNYHCEYCDYGEPSLDENGSPTLSIDQVKTGIDYWLSNTALSVTPNRSIRLGGGEPMLFYTLFRDTLAYMETVGGREDGAAPFRISLFTNASLVDEGWIDLIKRYEIRVGVSLDGREQRNDLRRRHSEGSAYARTSEGIRRLNAEGIRPDLRMTVSAHNMDRLAEDVAWLYDRFELNGFSFDLDTSLTQEYGLGPREYAKGIVNAYDKLSYRGLFDKKVLKLNATFKSKVFARGGCGGVFTHAVLFPDGSMGPCPSMAGGPDQRTEIDENRELNATNPFVQWSAFDYARNTTCQKCHYINICEAWCPYVSLQATGRIAEPNAYNCLFTKALVEWLIWYDFEQLKAAQA